MVSPEQLEALDLTLWLGAERLAAERACCNQSTISRRTKEVLRIFQLKRSRDDLDFTWYLQPNCSLLAMERRVHQLYRLRHNIRLRLEADAWLAPLLSGVPKHWLLGPFDGLGVARPLGLLRACMIDGWLSCSSHDLPAASDPDLLVIDLAQLPLLLVAHPSHPLVGVSGLGRGDLAQFPSVALADHLYPRFAAAARACGLWSDQVLLQRYAYASWEGLTSDQATIAYANQLSLLSAQSQGQSRLSVLDFDSGLQANVSLVLRRDLAVQSSVLALCSQLRARLQQLLA